MDRRVFPVGAAATLTTAPGCARRRVPLARDPGFARVVHRGRARVRPGRDLTARAPVTGLNRFSTLVPESPVETIGSLRAARGSKSIERIA